jgi:hypothetical protein
MKFSPCVVWPAELHDPSGLRMASTDPVTVRGHTMVIDG